MPLVSTDKAPDETGGAAIPHPPRRPKDLHDEVELTAATKSGGPQRPDREGKR